MSRSVDLFIDLEPPIESAAEAIRHASGLTLQPGDVPGTWSLDEGEVHAELHAHPYVDDGQLLLGRYRWALSCRVAHGLRLADAPETTLLRLVSEALHQAGVAVLLVHDLQYRDRVADPEPGTGWPETTEGAEPVAGPSGEQP